MAILHPRVLGTFGTLVIPPPVQLPAKKRLVKRVEVNTEQ